MMFLTEGDLRQQYRKDPFERFILEENTRLTPGAQQFLNDRKIHIIEANSNNLTMNQAASYDTLSPNERLVHSIFKYELTYLRSVLMEKARYIFDYNQTLADLFFELEELVKQMQVEDYGLAMETLLSKHSNFEQILSLETISFDVTKDQVLKDGGREASVLSLVGNSFLRLYAQYEESLEEKQKNVILSVIGCLYEKILIYVGGHDG